MAHFAKLNDDNEVIAVIVVSNRKILDANGDESEQIGIDFCRRISGHQNWKQTSYGGNFRTRYAALGCVYDAARDAFLPRHRFPSWVLNAKYEYEAPIPRPADEGPDNRYKWNETDLAFEPA